MLQILSSSQDLGLGSKADRQKATSEFKGLLKSTFYQSATQAFRATQKNTEPAINCSLVSKVTRSEQNQPVNNNPGRQKQQLRQVFHGDKHHVDLAWRQDETKIKAQHKRAETCRLGFNLPFWIKLSSKERDFQKKNAS